MDKVSDKELLRLERKCWPDLGSKHVVEDAGHGSYVHIGSKASVKTEADGVIYIFDHPKAREMLHAALLVGAGEGIAVKGGNLLKEVTWKDLELEDAVKRMRVLAAAWQSRARLVGGNDELAMAAGDLLTLASEIDGGEG